MPTLHSHTHYQVAPAQAQAKTWHRMYQSNRTKKMNDKPTEKKEHRSDIITVLQMNIHAS